MTKTAGEAGFSENTMAVKQKNGNGADDFFANGCGRCPLGGSPACKVHLWDEALALLRAILTDCGLNEERKWGVACYTYKGRNIVMLSALKSYCCLSFFKGSLLADATGVLQKPGENSQSVRQLRYTRVQEIAAREALIRSYVFEAIALEDAGLKVQLKKPEEYSVPAEFGQMLQQDPLLSEAFTALSPGRRRGYLLFFSAPKKPETRLARISKCLPLIHVGKGLHD